MYQLVISEMPSSDLPAQNLPGQNMAATAVIVSSNEVVPGKRIFWKEGPAITLPLVYLLKNLKDDTKMETPAEVMFEKCPETTLVFWLLYKCEGDETKTTGTFRSNPIFIKCTKKKKKKT